MSYAGISANENPQGRYDIYAHIHKAIRRMMFDTLNKVGSMDRDDAQDVAAGLGQVRLLAAFCRGHLQHENDFIHTAMESRRPGSTRQIAGEHEHHLWAIGQLEAHAAAAEQTSGAARQAALSKLYRYLGVFIGENLLHMNVEETEHSAVLWATHSDAELAAIERALVASLEPHESMVSMQWMIPALNPHERAAKLGGIRQHAPAPMFDALMGMARKELTGRDFGKLSTALGMEKRLAA